ncbi:cation-translocating P-type ATPase [Cryptosporangium arvum]|uniref:P-type Cu(+) transporter n=1 Tax=Cryptosporangium arvum DSM 44712 TaxID=927661 RepID=A0A010ZUS7_9ACTN|nr:HAD-IC family P-type ATPase [Cryptosporangium arvum]EXG82449.1 P-type ATPase, translocating [Cryptosporangium arvum DSM 44712]
MTTMLARDRSPVDGHDREATEIAALFEVRPDRGLTEAEAAARLDRYGPNELPEPTHRSPWLRFLDQFRSWLFAILFGAAVLAAAVGELGEAAVILLVLLINAVIGFVQERRAEHSLEALRQMLVATTRVRRAGAIRVVPARDVVPGDVVLLEAGDRVPADGRLTVAEAVDVDEAALTGESLPVSKSTTAVKKTVPVAERTSVLFMNSTLTRGRAEMVVTGTGMCTRIGAIAQQLRAGEEPPSPLQVQLDSLGRRLALLGGVAVVVYLVVELTLAGGESLSALALRSVALAVAAVPEGLPAVLAVTLALGVHRMARRGAIVRRLASVEALGSATVVCTDKTGTLTMNQMTARTLWFAGRRYRVTGEGYRPSGVITGGPAGGLPTALMPMVACNDAKLLADGGIAGDPTEAALLVLGAKAGLHAPVPRTGEVPFDAAARYMVTFHPEPDGRTRVYAKGALDVLLPRCSDVAGVGTLDAALERQVRAAAHEMADDGLRVLAGATAVVDHPGGLPDELTLVSVVGIADPPRPEARDAVERCRAAGVAVTMITGDHADTAAAIARELGIAGDVVTGAELDGLTEEELTAKVAGVGVFARVAPEHKVAIVRALAARGEIVAMTGDGVNDAPALHAAHIGVAMGRTGTDVAKEAAAMVLTDDDVTTIVRAIGQGRAIYDNVVTFVRFQLSTNIGAILALLAAPLLGLPAPLTALQLLWVNIIMDGPPAMALGVDPARSDVLRRRPRPVGERILSRSRLADVVRVGAVMAAGTLGVLALARGPFGDATAMSMAFTTFVLFQLVNVVNARAGRRTVFHRDQLRNPALWVALGAVLLTQIALVHLPWAESLFGTAALTTGQWAICGAVAASVVLIEEALRRITRS